MSILPIVKYPNPILTKVSEPITTFDQSLKELASDMLETMLKAPGAGLAAPQIGKNIRVIVMDNTEQDEEYGTSTLTLVNPVIVYTEGIQEYNEGCLSIDDYQTLVKRYDLVEVEYQDLDGNPLKKTAQGRKAVILQHEIDHLDGIMFIDRLSPLKKNMFLTKLRKIMKRQLSS
jgi:peptide deformylase